MGQRDNNAGEALAFHIVDESSSQVPYKVQSPAKSDFAVQR